MARAEIPFVVTKAQGAVSGAVADYAVSGASVLVNLRGGGPATVYAGETGGTTLANPLTTGSTGRIDGWLEEGSYDMVISGSGITTYTQPIEIVRGSGVGLLAANAVTTASIAAGAVTAAKLGVDVAGALIPSGTVWAFAGSSLPSGWLWCDGKAYDGTLATYLNLWNALGTTYGGTGQSSFAVPDLRGRTAIGADGLGTNGNAGRLTSNNARGNSGGAQSSSHSHTVNAHSHTVNNHTHGIGAEAPGTSFAGDHNHSFSGSTSTAVGSTSTTDYASGPQVFTAVNHAHSFSGITGGGGGHSHSVNSHSHGGATGGSTPGTDSQSPGTSSVTVSQLPPYQVFNFIIKL